MCPPNPWIDVNVLRSKLIFRFEYLLDQTRCEYKLFCFKISFQATYLAELKTKYLQLIECIKRLSFCFQSSCIMFHRSVAFRPNFRRFHRNETKSKQNESRRNKFLQIYLFFALWPSCSYFEIVFGAMTFDQLDSFCMTYH